MSLRRMRHYIDTVLAAFDGSLQVVVFTGGDAALVQSGLKDHNLRQQVEEELTSRYAQEEFEYLQYVYPDESAQRMHALSERIVNGLMGRKSR